MRLPTATSDTLRALGQSKCFPAYTGLQLACLTSRSLRGGSLYTSVTYRISARAYRMQGISINLFTAHRRYHLLYILFGEFSRMHVYVCAPLRLQDSRCCVRDSFGALESTPKIRYLSRCTCSWSLDPLPRLLIPHLSLDVSRWL